jgi:hypothetical protein
MVIVLSRFSSFRTESIWAQLPQVNRTSAMTGFIYTRKNCRKVNKISRLLPAKSSRASTVEHPPSPDL